MTTYLWDQAAPDLVFRAYSNSKRLRKAATWLRPGPPLFPRQSEEEDGERDPLLLLDAGDISWVKEWQFQSTNPTGLKA